MYTKFQKKTPNFADKTNNKNSFLLGFFIWVYGFQSIFLSMARLKLLSNYMVWWKYPFTRGKPVFVRCFLFNTQSWRTLPFFGHYCVPMHTNLFKILCFSCQGKSRVIVYQRICLFLWLIFAQHGLLKFNSLSTQPFHAWRISEFMT